MTRALRVVQRNALVYRRAWRGSVFLSFLQPTLFLLAMGLGVGAMVDRGGAMLPGGVPFLTFLAPGLLAAACMQTAAFESSWPIGAKILWRRNYEAMLATPVAVRDLVTGELAWMALRLLTVATAFTIVMVALGAARGPFVVLAIPAAVLTGLAFSAPMLAFAATIRTGNEFNAVLRFGITPLFLFSGVFFPISQLPGPLRSIATLTPLYHGVELTRGLTLGSLTPETAAIHVLYLAALIGTGAWSATRTFARRMYA